MSTQRRIQARRCLQQRQPCVRYRGCCADVIQRDRKRPRAFRALDNERAQQLTKPRRVEEELPTVLGLPCGPAVRRNRREAEQNLAEGPGSKSVHEDPAALSAGVLRPGHVGVGMFEASFHDLIVLLCGAVMF